MPNTPGTLRFPALLDDEDSLIRAANNAATTLTLPVGTGDTTLTVTSTSSFAATGSLSIDNEIIFYTGKTATTFTGCVRHSDGTVAASHLAGASVETRIVAAFHTVLSKAVVASESKLGSGASTPFNGRLLQGTGNGTSAWNTDVYLAGTLTLGPGATPTPTSVALHVTKAFTDPNSASVTGFYYGQRTVMGVNLTAPSVSGWRAYAALDTMTLQGSNSAESIFGRRIDVMNASTATITNQIALQVNVVGNPTSGTATSNQVLGVDIAAIKNNASTWNIGTLKMLNINGLQVFDGTISGTSLYGLFMGDYGNPAGTWTNKYALYVAGGTSYHKGNFGVGTTAASAQLHLGGSVSAASWGAFGIRLRVDGVTVTDTTASGTVGNLAMNRFGQDTVAATNATIYTNAATVYIDNAPTAGTNATLTNPFALLVNAGSVKFGGFAQFGAANSTPSVPTAKIHLLGNTSSAAWNANGIALRSQATTFTDSTSSGTVALNAIHSLGTPTIAASSATTFTNAANLYIAAAPAAGTNVTITNPYALYVEGGQSWLGGLVRAGGLIQVGAGSGSAWPQLQRDANASLLINTSGGATTGKLGVAVPVANARLHLAAGASGANSAPLKIDSGTNLTTAEAGTIEYNGRFSVSESDTTRRFLVQAASAAKTTAGVPYTNDGYIELVINGTVVKVMTTA